MGYNPYYNTYYNPGRTQNSLYNGAGPSYVYRPGYGVGRTLLGGLFLAAVAGSALTSSNGSSHEPSTRRVHSAIPAVALDDDNEEVYKEVYEEDYEEDNREDNEEDSEEEPYSEVGPIIIAVMGPTGAGKSTLIKSVVQDDNISIGHDLNSETEEVKEWKFEHDGHEFILVDTPGFDDSHRSNRAVTEKLLDWLAKSYKEKKIFNGIIYVHSIMSPRMQGSALQNQRMFEKLCGHRAMHNVVLATSFWDQVQINLGYKREKELKESLNFWGYMVKYGSRVVRLGGRQRNLKVIADMAEYEPVVLKAQDEMANQRKKTSQTSAAKVITDALEAQKMKHKKLKETLKADMEERARRQQETHQRELEKLRRETEQRTRRMEEEKKRQEEENRKLQEERRRQQEERERERERYESEQRREEEERQRDREMQEAEAELFDMWRNQNRRLQFLGRGPYSGSMN